MSQLPIYIGAAANDGTGSNLRSAFANTDINFGQLFSIAQPTPPATLYGKPGDLSGWYAYSPGYFYYCYANYTDGTSEIWGELSPIGNIAATRLTNGNTSVAIPSSGSNVLITVANVANIAQFTTAGVNIIGTVSATGQVVANTVATTANLSAQGNVIGNYVLGNGSQLTGITSYSNAAVAAYMATYTGNLSAGNLSVTQATSMSGNLSVTGNITTGNVSIGGSLSLVGNINLAGNVQSGQNLYANGVISATGNIRGGNVNTTGILTINNNNATTAIVNGGTSAVGNIGSVAKPFNTVFAVATSAQYADLAENYLGDNEYKPGTVVSFGGVQEITMTLRDNDTAVAGVVSTRPAYSMNSGLTGEYVTAVALMGRVPCQVEGLVSKGALMVAAGNGRARAESAPAVGTVIGKALEDFAGDIGTIEIVVGRV
jgi:hypothetical protein